MKTIKRILPLFCLLILSFTARAYVLFEDSSNYPYANGSIEGQGQWYCYFPSTPALDALVTNNVLLLYSNHLDSIAAPTNTMTGPTNGWINTDNQNITYASFKIMVTQLPVEDGDDDFFCEFRNGAPSGTTNAESACHVFIDTLGRSVPGTYRLGIANYDTEFNGADANFPPINYPEDLATDIWYTVVIEFGNNGAPAYAGGAALWINPSMKDYENFYNGDEYDSYTDTNAVGNYVYATDTSQIQAEENIVVGQIAFMPDSSSGNEGISNVIAGTEFADVFTTSLPVFGVQPLAAETNNTETNYSGNNATFYAVASGVDLNYQWYSQNYGKLSDGRTFANGDSFTGSTNDTLIVSNLSLTDTYYCQATDAYGNTATSSNATEVVITTFTPIFFPSETPTNVTTNVFAYVNLYNPAKGTGPIYYQWYFAPTNLPTTYSPLVGSNNDYINLYLPDYLEQGSYYVVASNTVDGGSLAFGPTNTITEVAPTTVTLQQLNQLYASFLNTPGQTLLHNTTYYLNQGGSHGTPITVGGYVTTYGTPIPGQSNEGGLGNSYAEFFIQDTNGYGAEVYGVAEGDTNQPPIGTYVVVSGPVEVYNTELEVAASSASAIIPTNAPAFSLKPVLSNAKFSQLATNMLGSTAVAANETLITFTNCYFYGSQLGAPVTQGGGYNYNGIFLANHANSFYMTVGSPYNPTNPATGLGMNPALPVNTNTLEVYQFGYDYPNNGSPVVLNPFDGLTIPTNCYQLTGVYQIYGLPTPGPEILPSRLADYVVNPPPAPTLSAAVTKSGSTISWVPQLGSTYSVYSASNILGPWTQAAYGLNYYPTNGAFIDPVRANAKFYYITSP